MLSKIGIGFYKVTKYVHHHQSYIISSLSFTTSTTQGIIPTSQHNPIVVFRSWLLEAQKYQHLAKTAHIACLSTINFDFNPPKPTSRMISVHDINSHGQFAFSTTFTSAKAKQISENNNVSLVFNWNTINKSVRIEGKCHKADDNISDIAWETRSRSYQLWAITTRQTRSIDKVEDFIESVHKTEKNYEMMSLIDRPEHWGVFLIDPLLIEFWKGDEHGFHGRYHYTRNDIINDNWNMIMIEP